MNIQTMTVNMGLDTTLCVLACGADIKNQFCFYRDGRLHLSGDNGDLSNPDNFARYLNSIRELGSRLGISPGLIAHDLHPNYLSSKARALFPEARAVGVQHHHAHIASVLAASDVHDTVIGVAFDGTGYGTEGTIWGGEFLIVSPDEWQRFGHLEYMKMPGGEQAVREPWRMAFSLLYDRFGDSVFTERSPLSPAVSESAYRVLRAMLAGAVNSPLTSSCGRLFDAVSSLLGLRHVASSEAEAAIALQERASAVEDHHSYRFDISEKNGMQIAGYAPLLESILQDLRAGVPVEFIARRFHNSLAGLVVDMAGRARRAHNTSTVALSGGVFQNELLYTICADLLKKDGFLLLDNKDVPVNDSGICVGQAYAAVHTVHHSGD